MSEAIDPNQCVNLLESLEGWEIVNGELVKVFSFGSYLEGLDFARKCGELAEEMNHHPDLLIQWRKVRVSIVTHSAGGLTGLDFDYAGKVEELTLE
jgi:4a-hydroxytetrahydrobiopterin dehydratase